MLICAQIGLVDQRVVVDEAIGALHFWLEHADAKKKSRVRPGDLFRERERGVVLPILRGKVHRMILVLLCPSCRLSG